MYYYYFQSLNVRDNVRDSLEKDPVDRTNQDLDILMEFTQKLEAFNQMTEAVRRALCSVMVFAVVEKAGTTVMMHGEELDSWSVIINGEVRIDIPGSTTSPKLLRCGDSFGITPTMDKLYHQVIYSIFTKYLLNIYSNLQHHVRLDRQLPDRRLQLPE